jgi:Beta-lactamase enzyme family
MRFGRVPSLRQLAPLIAVVALAGTGLGVLIISLARDSHAKKAATASGLARGPSRPDSSRELAPSRKPVKPSPRPHRSVVPAGAAASFARLQAQLPGVAGVAVAPLGDGSIRTFGPLQAGHAWSTMKVPVLATYIRQAEASDSPLSATFRRLSASAVERSDNAAINTVFEALEQADGGLDGASQELERTLELAGDATHVNTLPNNRGFSTFGQTEWSASDSLSFYRALARGCLLSPSHTSYLLGLMRNIEPQERWGAGAAGFPAPVAFKGGWGPEPGGSYLVRQTAVVGSGQHGYVISVLSKPGGEGEESFAAGQHALTRISTWARDVLDLEAPVTPYHCEWER